MRCAERRVHARGPMPPIYVTGHQNPDADSIAAAIGYAELKRRLDPERRVRAGPPRRSQRPDPVADRAQRGAAARAAAARAAAGVRRDARELPHRARRRARARGGPDDGARGPRPGADRRLRRRARGRDDRARAGAALHPRVARGVAAGRPHRRGRDRGSARGRARGRRRAERDLGPGLGAGHGRALADQGRGGRRGGGRRSPGRAAPRARARRGAARDEQLHARRATTYSSWLASARPRWSPPRSTPTSPPA